MAINERDLRKLVKDTLTNAGLYSKDAEEMLIFTAAVESHFGEYLSQVGGPAKGVYMMEPATEKDIHNNYLAYREQRANKVYAYMTMVGDDLRYNLQYQTLMARLHYRRVKEPLPDRYDTEGMASYWKKYWNTEEGKGNIVSAMEKYTYYIGERR